MKARHKIILLMVLGSTMGIQPTAIAGPIYTWIDQRDVFHISNRPPSMSAMVSNLAVFEGGSRKKPGATAGAQVDLTAAREKLSGLKRKFLEHTLITI